MIVGRVLLVLTCTTAIGCSDAVTQTLDRADAGAPADGSPDIGVTSDAGSVPDADATTGPDHLIVDGGDRPDADVCAGPVSVDFSATVTPSSTRSEIRIGGRARIQSWLPMLVLVFESGETVLIDGRIEGTSWPEPFLIQTVDADVLIRRPFWTEVSFHIRPVGGSAAPLPVASLTGWSHSRDVLDVAGGGSYVLGACASDQPCGRAAPLHLSVSSADGTGVFAPAGQRVDRGLLTVVNGSSSRQYLHDVTCEDLPTTWTSGFIVDRGL